MTTNQPAAANPNGAPANKAMVPAHASDDGTVLNAFSSDANFATAQRIAKGFAASELMPVAFRDNVANVLIAMEMAHRLKMSVFMVAQSIDVIHGRPSWRATFLIATVNQSGRFAPLRPKWFKGEREVEFLSGSDSDDWGCRAIAKDLKSGEECKGALITTAMAKAEGWSTKAGSKWKTMPEQMLFYRAASFWTRWYAPEISMGMQTEEEVFETTGVVVAETPAALVPGSAKSLEATLMAEPPATATQASVPHDPITGEVKDEPRATRQPGEDG